MQLWFTQHRYDAVRSADGFRHLENPELEAYISSMYSAPATLLKQADAVRGDYERQVSHLLPANLSSSTHHLRWYTSGEEFAPEVADPLSPSAAVQAIMDDRHPLAEMARNEVRYATGTWYALWRVQASCEEARRRILAHPLMQGVVIESFVP